MARLNDTANTLDTAESSGSTPTMEELTWAQKIEKHGYGIDVANATKEDLSEYTNTKIHVHVLHGFMDNTLWDAFKEEFDNFTTYDFQRIRTDIRIKLRVHLLSRGVYVTTHNSRHTISDALYDVVQEEKQHEWTDQELMETTVKIRPMITTALEDRLNSNKTGLAGPSIQALSTIRAPSIVDVSHRRNTTGTQVYAPRPLSPVNSTQDQPRLHHPRIPGSEFQQRRVYTQSPAPSESASQHQPPEPLEPLAQPQPDQIAQEHRQPTVQEHHQPAQENRQPIQENRHVSNWVQNQSQQPTRPAIRPTPALDNDVASDAYSIRPPSYHKEIALLSKIYKNNQKYDGNDSFDFKLQIFRSLCDRAGVPPAGYAKALPVMMTGLAESHWFQCSLTSYTFDAACTHIRNNFEGEAYYRENLTTWNAISLQDIINENPDKSISKCLQLLINKLNKHQHTLDPNFRNPHVLANKLVTACLPVPACQIALSYPTSDLGALINTLKSSIIAWEKVNPTSSNQTYFTDRKYYRDDRDRGNRNRDDQNPRNNRTGHDDRRNRPYRRDTQPKGKCYVCQKENCRSWKHTEEERTRSRDEYKRRFNKSNDNGRNGNFEDRFRQYIFTCEGQDDESVQAFETLVLNATDSTDEDTEDTSDSQSQASCFLTSITSTGTLTAEEATSTSVELANRAYVHLLTANAVKTTREDDPFSYTTTVASQHTSTVFMGIVIDTGAAKKSTAGHNQFKALQNEDHTVSLDTSTKGQVKVQFGIGNTASIRTTEIMTPVGRVQFHVVPVDTPFLLSLADINRLRIFFDNLRDVIVTRAQEIPVVRRHGHALLLWNSSLQSHLTTSFDENPCYLTDTELRRLHRRFGHPSVERFHKVLDRAGHEIDKKTLEQLTKYC
jgi:hypothetical protein